MFYIHFHFVNHLIQDMTPFQIFASGLSFLCFCGNALVLARQDWEIYRTKTARSNSLYMIVGFLLTLMVTFPLAYQQRIWALMIGKIMAFVLILLWLFLFLVYNDESFRANMKTEFNGTILWRDIKQCGQRLFRRSKL